MKRFLLSVSIILTALFFYSLKPPPFQISGDMVMENNFAYRLNISDVSPDYGQTQYTEKSKKILKDIDVKNLQKLRCSDGFIRTDQGVFVLENARTQDLHTKRIKNEGFLEYMRNKEPHFPLGTKILTARICELENKTTLLFYSIGSYDTKLADTVSIRRAIAHSENNTALVDVISKKNILGVKTVTIDKSPDHLRCDQTFQIDRANSLFTLCTEEGDRVANYEIFKVSLNSGSTLSIERCTNSIENISKSACR